MIVNGVSVDTDRMKDLIESIGRTFDENSDSDGCWDDLSSLAEEIWAHLDRHELLKHCDLHGESYFASCPRRCSNCEEHDCTDCDSCCQRQCECCCEDECEACGLAESDCTCCGSCGLTEEECVCPA